MKNTAANNLQYTGIVTLSQYIGKNKKVIAKVHNAGGQPLFSFLTDCLIGDFDSAKRALPTKIRLLRSTTDSTTGVNELTPVSGFIHFITSPEKTFNNTTSAQASAHYSFTIHKATFEDVEFNCVGLYPDSADELDVYDYAAICDFDLDTVVNSASVLFVDWELLISNHTSAQSSTSTDNSSSYTSKNISTTVS